MSSVQQQKITCHTNKKVWATQRKKVHQLKLSLKKTMADLLDNDFKTMVFKMLKELKEDVEKIKSMLYEQNGNINKKGKP